MMRVPVEPPRRKGQTRRALAGAAAVVVLPAAVGPAAAADELVRLRELHALVMDPKRSFSISRTLAELDEIEARLGAAAPDTVERGELGYLRGFVLYRAQRAEQSIPPSLDAIRIDEKTPFLSPKDRLTIVYAVGRQGEGLGRWPLAITHFRKALALSASAPDTSEDERLGTMERLAYCLQEDKQSAEAKAINEQVLASGERLFGRDSPKLVTVLNNLAQNVYDLGDKEAARPLLERRLRIASAGKDEDVVDDTLFQLGVLAFETGRRSEAEAHMKRRLALAQASGDKDRVTAARRDLDELYERLKR